MASVLADDGIVSLQDTVVLSELAAYEGCKRNDADRRIAEEDNLVAHGGVNGDKTSWASWAMRTMNICPLAFDPALAAPML